MEIIGFKENLSLSKILRFQMIDSCYRSRNEILIPAHAEDF